MSVICSDVDRMQSIIAKTANITDRAFDYDPSRAIEKKHMHLLGSRALCYSDSGLEEPSACRKYFFRVYLSSNDRRREATSRRF